MNITDYHSQYFAHELTRRFPTDSAEKLACAVASAQVDLNPHQIDAALGLGKTIEAGQKGKNKAGYGEQLIERPAEDLSARFGRGFSRQNLWQMRAFYQTWSLKPILQTQYGEFPLLPDEKRIAEELAKTTRALETGKIKASKGAEKKATKRRKT